MLFTKLFVASILATASAQGACSSWCNAWTCGFSSCTECETCVTDAWNGGACSAWCNAYTCGLTGCKGCAGQDNGPNCLKIESGDYCAFWCNSWTNSFAKCAGCRENVAKTGWTPSDVSVIMYNQDTHPVPQECQPEHSSWTTKYPFPRNPPIGYMEVPMSCCSLPGATTGDDLLIPLLPTPQTNSLVTAYRNAGSPCIPWGTPDSFGNAYVLQGCNDGKQWYGDGCKSNDALERCDCIAPMSTSKSEACFRGGDYPNSIRWFYHFKGCLEA